MRRSRLLPSAAPLTAALLLASALPATAAPPASSLTSWTGSDGQRITLIAASGVANRFSVTNTIYDMTFEDASGAPITRSGSCGATNTALPQYCNLNYTVVGVLIDAGDMDDSIAVQSSKTMHLMGNTGDDTLRSIGTGVTHFFGGPATTP